MSELPATVGDRGKAFSSGTGEAKQGSGPDCRELGLRSPKVRDIYTPSYRRK
ncbi:hypothetical protein X744_29285 [Mesorhizobium sp. LNJC372A00]|nr:hypothetical protein X745_28975 [Mesorhizobium sp. LNJC374B00]ESY52205.1 hypothetical protein X744_29285 [Mesorhizobium sp. LNJC372A00]